MLFRSVRQLKNITEQISIIETNREIDAKILRSYLPEMNNHRFPAIIKGKDQHFESEREILYTVLFDMRKEVAELKKMVHNLMAERSANVPIMDTPSQTPTNTLPTIIHTVKAPVSEITEMPLATEYVEETPLSLDEVEKEMIRKALERHNGKRKNAAQDLNISERTLYRKIKEYGLD